MRHCSPGTIHVIPLYDDDDDADDKSKMVRTEELMQLIIIYLRLSIST